MREIRIIQKGRSLFAGPIYEARSFKDRFWGLMGKQSMADEEGIFFPHVSRVHTSFMKFPIDVVYFDKDYVLIFKETLFPWQLGSKLKRAAHVLELNRGVSEKFSGGRIKIEGMNND